MLTMLELLLVVGVACTDSSASWSPKLSPAQHQRFFNTQISPVKPLHVIKVIRPREHTPSLVSATPARPASAAAHSDPNVVPYCSNSAPDWSAQQHPVYGYTNPDFDYKSEVTRIHNTVQRGYKITTTSVEKGHQKKWMAL